MLAEEDTPGCHCSQTDQSARHTVEECVKLTELGREVEKDEMVEWWTRHSRIERERKGIRGLKMASKARGRENGEIRFQRVSILRISFVMYSPIACLPLYLCHLRAVFLLYILSYFL